MLIVGITAHLLSIERTDWPKQHDMFKSMWCQCMTTWNSGRISSWKYLPFNSKFINIFARGQFWPPGIVVACVCVCVCINHLIVRTITGHLFMLGSPNLVQRSKTPWLRFLLFWGQMTLTFKVKFNFKLKIDPILSLPNHCSPPILVRISKFGQQMHFRTVKIPVNLGLEWPWP